MATSTILAGPDALQSLEMGNKIKNLALLAQAGVRTPRGFGLTYNVYESHINKLIPKLEAILSREEDYRYMANQMYRVITNTPLANSESIITALKDYVADADYFAVRSSGSPILDGHQIAEDSLEASLAGQYESFLMVPSYNVSNAILCCFASLFSERCLQQFNVKENIDYMRSRMSVLIQEMCPADFSAVVMTRDPVEGGDSLGIEITYGACDAIVSGEVQGDLYILSRTTGSVLNSEVGTKNSRVEYQPLTDTEANNRTVKPLSIEQRSCYAAPQELINQIYELSMFIERQFGIPQDIELVVSERTIIVTQSRPITASN